MIAPEWTKYPEVGGLAGEEQGFPRPEAPLFARKGDQLQRFTRKEVERTGPPEPCHVVVEGHSVRPPAAALGHELIAAALGDKKLRLGRIVLDLLPQTINMRLERVRGDVGVIAPDILEQRLARHGLFFGAMEIA